MPLNDNHTYSIPLNHRIVQADSVNTIKGNPVVRHSRFIDESLKIVEGEDGDHWVNFTYVFNNQTEILIFYMAKEGFDKAKRTHYFQIDPSIVPRVLFFRRQNKGTLRIYL